MNECMRVPTIHVVDDEVSLLNALSRLLRAAGYTVSTFRSASEFLAQLSTDAPGCVIADLRMPDSSGLELQESLARMNCAMPIVFLTGYGDVRSAVQAMRHGAEDFLPKDAPREQLFDAVRRALDRDHRGREGRERQRRISKRFALLTPREREVLGHVLLGKLNKQIARDLDIHERTVKLHRTSITTKLEVHSVAELTHLAHEAGIVKSPAVAITL